MNIYLSYGIFLVLLGLLYYLSYLYYKLKRGYYVWIFLLFLLITFYYYWYIFPFLFSGSMNFASLGFALLFVIILVITIILSFFKNKIYIHYFLSAFLLLSLLYSIPNFLRKVTIYNGSIYTKLAKKIISNSWSIDDNVKNKFEELSKKSVGNLTNNFYTEKAKKLIWMYDLEYCKKTKSNKCYLEFIRWKEWLNWYKNFSEKYNFLIKKYWKDIKKEIIIKWLEKDIRDNIIETLKKSKIEVYEKFKLKYDLNIKNKKVSIESFFKEWNISILSRNFNYFPREYKKDIIKKRSIIEQKILNFENIFWFNLKNVIYKKSKDGGAYNNMIDVFIYINNNNYIISYNDFNDNLCIKWNIDIEKYLTNYDYKKNYFDDLVLLHYYFINNFSLKN